MKIAIVHLSDIHIRCDGKNSVFNTADPIQWIVAALRSTLSGYQINCVFVAITGDIANYGLSEEYDNARQYFKQLLGLIESELPGIQCHLVMVPGNHDCDFRSAYLEVGLRNRILTTDGLEHIDPYTAQTLCAVQRPYFTFANEMMPPSAMRTIIQSGPCVDIHDFKLSGGLVRFYLLNTAWMSEQQEKQGKLVFPTAGLRAPTDQPSADIVFVLQHHPRSWFRASNSREFMRCLDGLSDLILTGHEHDSDDSHVSRSNGAQIDYIEGLALQSMDHDGKRISAFKIVIADTETGTQNTHTLSLDEKNIYLSDTESPLTRPLSRNPKRLEDSFTWTEKGTELASDLGIPLERSEGVRLEDLFVYPLIREQSIGKPLKVQRPRFSAEKLSWLGKKVLLTGTDLSGKTTLGRVLFNAGRKNHDCIPVFVRGIDIQRSAPKDCRTIVDSAYKQQYMTPVEKFRQHPKEKKIIIIDDLHRSRLRGTDLSALFSWLELEFGTIVSFADNMLLLLDDAKCGFEKPVFESFLRYEILPFGHIKRDELVQRWCALHANSDDIQETKQRAAKSMQKLDAIMGKRFVPHVPLFIIGILQQVEGNEGPDNYTASQGAVFEALATLRLQTNFKDHVLTARNYLANLAHSLYTKRQRFMSASEFEQWHQSYCKYHKLQLVASEMKNRLVDSQILQVLDGEIGFRHRFGYYLFVADYLARHMEDAVIRQHVAGMFEKVFHEEVANILVFLCFKATGHTEFIVNAMLQASKSMFSDRSPARLDADVREFSDIVQKSIGPKIESVRPDIRRTNMLASNDSESESNPYGHMRDDDLRNEDDAENSYPPEIKAVYAAVRSIQILGQILRNFYGTLIGEQKVLIAKEAYDLSMRLTAWYFQFVSQHHKEIARFCANIVSTTRPALAADPERLDGEVRQIIVNLTEMVSTAMVKRAAEATALPGLQPVFQEVLVSADEMATSASYQLINFELMLNISTSSVVGEIRAAARSLRDNPYAFRILQHLAATYLQVNYVDIQTTQQICEAAKIKLPIESFDSDIKRLPRSD